MKRTPFKQKAYKPMKRTRLKVVGDNDTALKKQDIQDLVRDIVILRDGGCLFKNEKGHVCTGFAKDGHLILQADHLLSRGNSATFADTRLIVCVCKGIHGWKSVGSNLRKAEYDERIKKLLSPERVQLWEKCDQAVKAHQSYKPDWSLAIVALKKELKDYQDKLK